jgi:hypothetical protein
MCALGNVGKTVNKVGLRFQGAGHGGGMPVGNEKAGVALLTASDAGFVAVVSARSGATLAADYDVFHGIEITGINHVVDAANHYYLAAIPESGANYAARRRPAAFSPSWRSGSRQRRARSYSVISTAAAKVAGSTTPFISQASQCCDQMAFAHGWHGFPWFS